jgi:hypothetical protein
VSLALSPWGVTARVTHEPSPGTDLPGAARRAAALSRRLAASVLVWISSSDQGSLLWIYELDTDEVSTRELGAAPPFSSPDAAAVALSLKTLLRTTEVAPQAERFGAAPARPEPPVQHLTLEAGGDVRYLARATTEVRATVGGVWWFRPAPTRFGAGLEFGAGPGVQLERPNFVGQFRQLSLSGALIWQVVGNRFLASALSAGASAHFSELSGFSENVGRSAVTRRVVPSLDAGTEVDLSLGAGYLVQGAAVFELWPIAAEFGVRLGVNLL